MTKQLKSGMGKPAIRGAIARGIFKLFSTLLLLAFMLQFQSEGRAQANLVNLYDWSNNTQVGYDPNPNDYINLSSFNSANFYGDLSPSGFAVPILTGTLNTAPGTTYEISFTVENQNIEACSSHAYFGGTSTVIDLPPAEGSPFDPTLVPVNVDFTAVATSTATDMSFAFALDNSGVASLYDLQVTAVPVTAVPETSTSKLFALGLIVIFAWKSRQFLQMPARKLVVAR